LLMDGVGTGKVPPAWGAEFDRVGLSWRIYSPFGLSAYFQPSRWRRLHRKLCAIDPGGDDGIAFCGGINLLDDYFDPNHGELDRPRFDFAVSCTGPVVTEVAKAQDDLWHWGDATRHARRAQVKPMLKALQKGSTRVLSTFRRSSQISEIPSAVSGIRAGLLLRDNFFNRTRIERAYRQALGQADHDIWIANAYFVPGGKLLRALLEAARRGVRVTLLLQGKHEYFFQVHATRYLYGVLLKAGIRIVEYKASFLHAKVAVVDADHENGAWATVGSSNLDPFSLLMAREANLVLRDAAFAQELRADLQAACEREGAEVQAADFLNRPWFERWADALAYGVMRASLWLLRKRY
jgi:cardiolipin synthase A/B